jgi:hypothetical protein
MNMTSLSPHIAVERYTLILPTAEIVTEFREYESTLFFFEDGLKGVVKDLVLSNTVSDPTGMALRMLTAQVVSNYENSLHVRYMENTLGTISPSIYIELIVEQLEIAVSAMLRQILRDMLPTYRWDHRQHRWLGNDLIANLILNETRQPP